MNEHLEKRPHTPATPATTATPCTCHREQTSSHELCCGHDEGRNPDCPIHGDGYGRPGAGGTILAW